MSRKRMVNKVRTNDDFKAITAFLDRLGLPFRVEPPPGKGHPIMWITLPTGAEVRTTITCTPRGGGNKGNAISTIKRVLLAAGVKV